MAYQKTKSTGGGVKDPFRNDVVTTNELNLQLRQLAKDVEFYELEPLEVMDIYRPNTQNGIFVPGVVKGRNVISEQGDTCLLYTSPSPRDRQKSRMPSSA